MTRPSLYEAVAAKTAASLDAGDTRTRARHAQLGLLDGLAQLARDAEDPAVAAGLTPVQRTAVAAYRTRQARLAQQDGDDQ
ncbi:hypothetical protein ABZU32_20380 [Sphaerisporangium sp. NPDC005288]|uniref:hypothetical protein n=1 Tax=Sphaerisporangium sp. NPDC005288 TaxID=3155114 RepID=UPI0033B2BE4C